MLKALRNPTDVPFPNPYRGLRGLPGDVWIVAATTLVNRVGMMALPFLVLYLTRYLHISAARAGFAITAYGLGGLLTAPIAGRLADRVGPYTVVRASLSLSGVILLVFPLARSYGMVLVLTFVWAVVADATRPATMAALTTSAPEDQRKAAIALNRLAINLGMSIGPAVGGFLALVSFPLLFIVDGLTSLASAALLSGLLWARSRRRPHAPGAQEPRPRAAVFSRPSVVWRDPAALLVFATSILLNIVFTQHEGAMPLYLVRDLQYRESFFGALFVLNTLIIVAIEVPLNVAMAHWSARPTLALATVLVAVGFGALAIAHAPLAIAVTVAIWTFGEMIFFPTATAYVAQLAPEGRTGEYMGGFAATFSVALIVGPWLGAALLDRVGGPATWLTMLAIGLSASALMAFAPERASRVAVAE
jgi:predicted MFS family arabinose efflux permease